MYCILYRWQMDYNCQRPPLAAVGSVGHRWFLYLPLISSNALTLRSLYSKVWCNMYRYVLFFAFLKGGSLASADVKALRATRILEQGHAFCNWKGRQVLTLDNEEEAKFKAIEETLALELVEAFQKELDLPSLDDSNNEEGRPELEEENRNVEPQKSGGGGGKKSKNVAMAAILRQATTTTTGSGSELAASERQVTFKTPSPNLSEDSGSQISQEDSRFVFLKNYLKIVIIFFSKLLIYF